jgi:hypothetical protein
MILAAFKTLWRGALRLSSSAISSLQMQKIVMIIHDNPNV